MSAGGARSYASLSTAQRAKATAALPELVQAAENALQDGFAPEEAHEVIYVHARRLKVYVWPALAERIVAAASRAVPAQVLY